MKPIFSSSWKILFCLSAAGVWVGSAAGQSQQTVEIAADDLLRFDKALIRVKKGTEVTFALKNVGRISNLRHNFVLLKPGTDAQRFANAAMNEKGEGIPASMADSVLVHTSFAGPGQTVRASFRATQTGSYVYLCSFPGHASVFQGKLVVE